jgi:putative heme-binding domain-containing protein
MSPPELVHLLAAPGAVTRLHVQGEILSRSRTTETTNLLVALAADGTAPLEGRAAAIFTLKQLDGADAHPVLLKLAESAAVREFALRALTDRLPEIGNLDPRAFVSALVDSSPRVQAQALISLNRLNNPSIAISIIPLTSRTTGSLMPTERPVQNQPDPGRVVPHLAVRTLVALHAVDACLEALDGQHWHGALWALRYMHNSSAVEGLIKKLGAARNSELRRAILATLIRLYHREADYHGTWWGIRPDNTGPYYDRAVWEMTPRIGSVVTAAVLVGDPETVGFLKGELARHQVSLAGIPLGAETVKVEKETPITLPKADANNPDQIGNLTYENAARRVLAAKGDPRKGEAVFKSQSCSNCHTTADGQNPKGPHLVDIGKRYKADELVESILRPSVKLAQGYDTYQFATVDGLILQGFIVSQRADATVIREANGVQRELKNEQIELKQQQKQSAMPDGLTVNLTPDQLADVIAFLQSLK